MKVAPADYKQLRLALIAAVSLLVLGAVALVMAIRELDAATKIRDSTRLARVSAQERVSQVSDEEREIRENLVYYEKMRQSGVLEAHNRLDWIDTITKIKNDRKLFEVKYSIAGQKPLDYPGIIATSGAEFVVSRVKLDILALHEGDFLDFLADIQNSGKSHVSVQRCTVERIERGLTALQPRLRAQCELDLVSVKGVKPT